MGPIILTLFISGIGNIVLLLLLWSLDTKYQDEDHEKFLKVFSPEVRKSIKECSDFIKDIERK